MSSDGRDNIKDVDNIEDADNIEDRDSSEGRDTRRGAVTPELQRAVEQYIREHYIPEPEGKKERFFEEAAAPDFGSLWKGLGRDEGAEEPEDFGEAGAESSSEELTAGSSSEKLESGAVSEDLEAEAPSEKLEEKASEEPVEGSPEEFAEEAPKEYFDVQRIEFRDEEPVLSSPSFREDYRAEKAAPRELDDLLRNEEDTFSEKLLHLIDEKGYTDAEVYKRAHIDRKLFSKIRSNEEYIPRKRNVIALALALRLNPDEAADLLRRAGMALSPSSKSDLIAEYCIQNGIYNINIVNELLDEYGEPILG